MRKTTWVWIGGLAAVGGIAGVVWGRSLPHSGTVTAAQAAAASSFAASVGTTTASPSSSAPVTTAFQLSTLEGQIFRVPNGHPVVLYFMSAQCASCAQGEQQLTTFMREAPHGVQVLSLDVTPTYDSPSTVLAMARDLGVSWPQAYATVPIMEAYDVTALDQVAVVNGQGHVVYDGALPSTATLLDLVHEAGTS